MSAPNDTARVAAGIAGRIAGESLPYRVVGYNPVTTEDTGEIVLLVQRSPLELAPLTVLVRPAILKQIVGAYIVAEGQAELAPNETAALKRS